MSPILHFLPSWGLNVVTTLTGPHEDNDHNQFYFSLAVPLYGPGRKSFLGAEFHLSFFPCPLKYHRLAVAGDKRPDCVGQCFEVE